MTVLRKAFDFSGRSTRKEFWGFQVFTFVVLLVVGKIGDLLHEGVVKMDDPMSVAIICVGVPFITVILMPLPALFVRRLHDTNRSGMWWWASFIIPGIILAVFFFALLPSDLRENKYGPLSK